MAAYKTKKVSHALLSNLEKGNTDFTYLNDFDDTAWTHREGLKPEISSRKVSYPIPGDAKGLSNDSGDDPFRIPVSGTGLPEVNLKNVMGGIYAILTGRNKDPSALPKLPSSNVLFLGSKENGDTFVHPSVYLPSAPPFLEPNTVNYRAYKEVLEAEPPEWLPDSSTTVCMQCNSPFTALTRGRHHCRFCGGIFCRVCSKGRCLLPAKFRERNPQRVCDTCYDRLDPLQVVLINTISNATQVAKYDVMDWTSSRGWLNLPVGFSMEHEIYKSSITLRNYSQVAMLNPEKSIPAAVLKGARGLAILTIVKAGALLSYKVGTGLVVARRSDGSWSAPSAILSFGLGWGAQFGGELMDFIIVLHDSNAVKTFCSRMHFSLGAGCSAAAGPIGRVAEADLRAGEKVPACVTLTVAVKVHLLVSRWREMLLLQEWIQIFASTGTRT